MAVVTLQIGQCGNQIGCQFFSTLMSNLLEEKEESNSQVADFRQLALERCFYKDVERDSSLWQARAVMVDMESKVIPECLQEAKNSKTWCYADGTQFSRCHGSGNNWARGYCTSSIYEPIMNMIQKQVEKCDHFGGFLALSSLAGGTGSGVGAHVSECLRDEYPHSFLVNEVVWPYRTGEVIIQDYNAVLTLARLYHAADAILTFDNDSLHYICRRLMGASSSSVSFQDLNKVIAEKMTSVLLPAYPGQNMQNLLIRSHIGELLETLVPHPEYKLLTLRNIPQLSENTARFSSFQWQGLMKHMYQMLIANAACEEGINWQVKVSASSHDYNKCVANLLILRGKDVESCDVSAFSQCQLYAQWSSADHFKTWSHPHKFGRSEKSAALLSNSQSPVPMLSHVIEKAWKMFASRAYIHQYLKHGLTEEEFVDSFVAVEQVLTNYKNL